MSGAGAPVKAAGGLLVRRRAGAREVAVVHRPRYDDWSLPKGKLERGEAFEDAALREIEEETGMRCELGPELEPNAYVDHKGRPKTVRWWLMRLPDDDPGSEFEPNDEVDELRWLSPWEAAELVHYEHDRKLILGLEQGS